MGHGHNHGHNHHHHHGHHVHSHGKSLFIAIIFNVLLTLVQIVAGIFSGSLSLIADALHNLSDAGALIIAYLANKISGLSANEKMTFGYGRAQILGALINSTTLAVVGIYLMYEAVVRFFNQTPVDGWILIYVAGFALIVDLITAYLTFSGSKESINMRAAFIHNVSDALASLVVIISGIGIVLFKIYWIDLVATILISIYVMYHSFDLIKESVRILMQGVPYDINTEKVREEISLFEEVKDVHHTHIWSLNDKFRSLEGHIVVNKNFSMNELESLKYKIKDLLKSKFKINHSTLEFECSDNNDCKKKGETC